MKKTKLLILSLLTLASSSMWGQSWTNITDDNVATSEDNLLQNPDFATLGPVKDGTKYNIGEPWTWSIGTANIRVEASGSAKSGGNVLIWRGSGNSNYISQSVKGIKPNTWYEVKMSQVANGNANATFYIGIGTSVGNYDVASNTVILGTDNNGIKTIYIVTPSDVSESTTYYFTFANTTNNTASSGSDPVSQIDWISLVECYEDLNQVSGTYYLYNEESGQFYSRGNAWGTRSITDNYGYPVIISPKETGVYAIKMLDASQSIGLGNNLYTDNGSPVAWTFDGNKTDGFTIYNSELGYFSVGGNHEDTKCVSDVADASKWKLISQNEHKAIIANQLVESRLGAIVAAGITGVTVEDADDYLKDYYVAKDYTSKIQSASLTNSHTGWTWTQTADRNKGSLKTNENGSEIYQGVGKLTQTVSGLDKGIYKVTIQGFYRDGSNANCVTYDKAGWQMSNMYFQANDFETRVMGWAEDRASDTNPNSMAEYKTLADGGKYMNTFYTYVDEDGKLDLTLGLPSYPVTDNGFWAIFSNVTLTYYSELSSANMTISDAKWATFCAPFDVDIPTGVKAYSCNAVEGTTLTLEEVATTIPANNPVILQSDETVGQTFYGEAVSGTPTVGYLTGVYEDTTVPTGSYVLVNRDGAKFVVVDGTPATVPANRAYLTVPSGVKEFALEDATGIAKVVPAFGSDNESIFNLAGQRVGSDFKGIVIKNGKKQLNK